MWNRNKFDDCVLVVEKNRNFYKIVNAYIVYDLDTWSKIRLNNFTKKKLVYIGYGIAFDGTDSWSSGSDFARNVVIFSVDNSPSSHADNQKNDFLVVAEGDTFSINGSFGTPEKKLTVNFSKGKTKFCLSLHYNRDNSYLFFNGKKI